LLKHRSNYAAAYAGFAWPRLDRFNWALDYFDPMASDNSRTALWIVEEGGTEVRVSFAEIAKRSNQVANFLRSLGVQRGDRLLVLLGNEPPLWEVLLAGCKLGAVAIPAATLLTPEDLRDRLNRGQVRHVLAASAHAHKFADLDGDYTRIGVGGETEGWQRFEDAYGEATRFVPDGATRASDPLLLYFTSGTTSKPKLVQHSHQSYPVGHLSTMYWIGLQEGDVHWNISSPGWAKHAWSSVFAPWNAGATVFVYNYARLQAKAILDTLVCHDVTTLCAPPTVWRILVQEKLADYRVKLREIVSAGEPLNPEVIEQVKAAWGIVIRDGFGQTETTALVGNTAGQPVKPGSMGRPLPGYRIELLEDGRPCEEGEVCLNLSESEFPLGIMHGYVGDAQIGGASNGAYYHTGDIAARDSEGYFTYIGRADDIFKASDYRISPFELESVLVEHPAVMEAAVVPSPDPIRLAVPKAFVTPSFGYSCDRQLAHDIFIFLRRNLAPFKRVRRLEFCELPKTISGKIRRADLRRREQERGGGSERNAAEFLEEDFPDLL
jgi:acetyl-CoA synthetase